MTFFDLIEIYKLYQSPPMDTPIPFISLMLIFVTYKILIYWFEWRESKAAIARMTSELNKAFMISALATMGGVLIGLFARRLKLW